MISRSLPGTDQSSEQENTFIVFLSYLVFHPVNVLQINRYRILSRVFGRDVTYSVGRQVRMAILIIRNLKFPVTLDSAVSKVVTNRPWIGCRLGRSPKAHDLPLIQTHRILNEQ